MFGFRRARKSSPDPDRRHEDCDSVTQQSTPQSRRRTKLMPSIATSPTVRKKIVSLPLYQAPGSSTCNSFLLGGHYYPGKDKKAKHLRQRTWWYRIFCSSTWRTILSLVFVSYLLLWQVLVPTVDVVLFYGKMLAGKRTATAGMRLVSIGDQKVVMDRVKRMKDTLRGSSRLKLLEKIAPEFYHRNDEKEKESQAENVGDGGKPTTVDASKHDLERHLDDAENRKPVMDTIQTERGSVERMHKKAGAGNHRQQHKAKKQKKTDRTSDVATKRYDGEHHIRSKTGNDANRKPEITGEIFQKKSNDLHDAKNHDTQSIHEVNQPHPGGLDHNNTSASMVEETKHSTEKEGKPTTKHAGVYASLQNNSQLLPSPNLKGVGGSMGRTLLNVHEFLNMSQCPGSVETISTTLLIQCSLDRLWILQEETCRRWRDPIVVVVYLKSREYSFDELNASCPQLTVVPFVAANSEQEWHYPVNHLRNLGLDVVQTSHVLVIDADFVPSEDLQQTIRDVLENRRRQRNVAESQIAPENRDAIVIPAFERVEDCSKNDCNTFLRSNSSFLPHNMDELQDCVKSRSCAVFQSKNNWEGHYSTQSHVWLRGDFYEGNVTLVDHSLSKIIRRVPCFDSLRYEPYVVIRWCPSTADQKPVAPYYDERFYGYGKNKIQLISHLRFLGYQFSILPGGFIVHNPHQESDAKHVWNDVQDFKLHEIMDALYPKFLRELYSMYHNVTDPQNIVQKCRPDEKKK